MEVHPVVNVSSSNISEADKETKEDSTSSSRNRWRKGV